jgi:hypothetical protein
MACFIFSPLPLCSANTKYLRPNRMQPILKRRHDTEVAAPAAQPPQQIGVLALAGRHHAPIRHHDLRGDQVIAAQPVLVAQPAEPTAQRQPGNPRAREDSTRRGKAVRLRRRVQFAPRHTALSTSRACLDVHLDLLHG